MAQGHSENTCKQMRRWWLHYSCSSYYLMQTTTFRNLVMILPWGEWHVSGRRALICVPQKMSISITHEHCQPTSFMQAPKINWVVPSPQLSSWTKMNFFHEWRSLRTCMENVQNAVVGHFLMNYTVSALRMESAIAVRGHHFTSDILRPVPVCAYHRELSEHCHVG